MLGACLLVGCLSCSPTLDSEVVRAVPGVSVLGCHACSWPWSMFPVRVLRVGFCVPVRVGRWSVPCWAVCVELACSILRVGACWCVLVRVSGRAMLRAGRVLAACWLRVGRVLAACWPRGNCCQPGPTFFGGAATCPGQLRCLGQNLFSEIRPFLKKPLVPGSFAAWGRTCSHKSASF